MSVQRMQVAPLKDGWRISMLGQVEGEVDIVDEVVVVVVVVGVVAKAL